ncbi:MAG TPA: flagellar hook protein FlgE [Verrucomicrobiae bacterium]|nr:flagellar hook protein FlgE [Verrucomicrobiae bacterium]
MGSFSTSLAGLEADSQDLSVISNNLANLNTVAYKGATASFQDLFYQQIGSSGDGNPIQVGVGTKVGAIPADFTQGTIQSTGVDTDVAIEGSGFFVASENGAQVYTRAGNFSVNADGTLQTSDGATILGLPATNGVINTNATPGPITISQGQINPPNPTTTVGLTLNLDSGTAAGQSFSTPITVYDSLGTAHVLTYTFTNTAPGSWTYAITIPAADVGGTGAPVTINSGTLTFNGSGQLTAPAANVTGIAVTGLADGANNLNLTWDLYDSTGTGEITQVASPSSTTSTQQDGYPSGSLNSYTINSNGVIEGTFSNGQTQALGQILLANFPDVQGLVRDGANEFSSSLASGAPVIAAPGTGGLGTLSGGSLEQSNVDISTQFAQLILAQSGYEANAKVVTTLDTITQATINLIQ